MKQIFTLLALGVMAQASAQSSANEDFESYANTSQLTAKCWEFSSVTLNTTTGINSTKSLQVVPLSGNGQGTDNNAQIVTPYINLIAGTTLTVEFRLTSKLTGSNTRTIQFSSVDINGIVTPLPGATLTLNATNTSSNPVFKQQVAISRTGVEKLVIDFNATGDVSNHIYVDNLLYASTFNNTGLYFCVAASPLPVKLMNFQGAINSNKARLQWSVADNETGNFFQVLRSADGRNFTEAGTVFINGKVGAESYTFADSHELDAVTYYKLKIVNKDGSVSYSNIIALKSAAPESRSALTILQNPVTSTLNFNYTSSTATQSTVTIYSTTGVKVYSSRLNSSKGTSTVSLNLDSHLAAGTYLLEVANGVERSVARMVKN